MRMRLPVLIVAGVVALAVLWIPDSRRLASIILRAPIVLWRQASALLSPSQAPPSAAVEWFVPAHVAETRRASPPIGDVSRFTGPRGDQTARRRPVAFALGQQQVQEKIRGGSASASERLREQTASVMAVRDTPISTALVQPPAGSGPDTAMTASPASTVVEPPVAAQPPVTAQPPAGVQPPSGLVPPGGLPLPTDGLLPPGGFPSPRELLNALPVGTVIGPGGVAQLPGGVQLQLPGATQPGQVQIGPVQVGPVQTGPIQVGAPSGPGQGGPVQIGPVQIGPIQIGPVQINPLPR
jgi:hypothetical protein